MEGQEHMGDSATYLKEYVEDTDNRVTVDAKRAVGGMWFKIGKIQIDFMKAIGMKPNNTLLDLGCGTLRAGRHFIRYLNERKYTGCDISENALGEAFNLIAKEKLQNKSPRILSNQDLKFERFAEERRKFDYILAQSVFTHLLPEHIEECFSHIGKIMKKRSRFYFTFRQKPKIEQDGVNIYYPYSFFEDMAKKYNFKIRKCKKYKHPRKQIMVEVKK